MMTPWMRCLEYQALCLLHFIWEQLQQKTSQQSIQHSRWQLFVSISPRFFVISEGAFLFCSILYDSPKWPPLASNCLALLVWVLNLFESNCSRKLVNNQFKITTICVYLSKGSHHFWRSIPVMKKFFMTRKYDSIQLFCPFSMGAIWNFDNKCNLFGSQSFLKKLSVCEEELSSYDQFFLRHVYTKNLVLLIWKGRIEFLV